VALAALLAMGALPAWADEAAAKKWIDSEFQPSTLTKAQMKRPRCSGSSTRRQAFQGQGMEIKVVSETITTHEYESKTLAKAFAEITGIKVKHDLIQEGDVVEKLQTSDAVGREHLRRLDQRLRPDRHALALRQARDLTDWMAARARTSPTPASTSTTSSAPVHHRARRQALPAARPAVRQPLLVPLRLVQRRGRTRPSSRPSTATTWACR
jgi:hypothetical protein